MAWPSWFPQGARPKGFTDWPDMYIRVIPREWPKNLFGPGTEGEGDHKAFGESLALARDFLQQVLAYLWPQTVVDSKDDDGIFLEEWETVFGLRPATSELTERARRVVAAFRNRGTMTAAQVKAIMAPVFGSNDPADISFSSPTAAEVVASGPTTDEAWTRDHTSLHIYHTGETAAPDFDMGKTLVAKIKPTGDTWTFGQYELAKWDTQGTWDHACWS